MSQRRNYASDTLPGATRHGITVLRSPKKSKTSVEANLTAAGGCPAAAYLAWPTKSNQKKAAPGVAPRIHGVPLCCLPRCGDCGTRPGEAHTTRLTAGLPRFPAGVSLGRNPRRGHLYRHWLTEARRLFPQTELRLTSHRCTVLVDFPTSSRAARRASRGKEQKHSPWLLLSPESYVLSPAFTPSLHSRHSRLLLPLYGRENEGRHVEHHLAIRAGERPQSMPRFREEPFELLVVEQATEGPCACPLGGYQ